VGTIRRTAARGTPDADGVEAVVYYLVESLSSARRRRGILRPKTTTISRSETTWPATKTKPRARI
jgi:hypothetical protein